MQRRRVPACAICILSALLIVVPSIAREVRLGTWKTPQTIQPFFYERFLPSTYTVRVFPFTNPADQKTALLAGSLEMCGTTLAHAIHSGSQGQPVVLVAAHVRATKHLNAHPDQWLQRAADFGTPLHILKKAASNMEPAWSMDKDFIVQTRALGNRMQALGVIERQPDYEALFDLRFVRKVPGKPGP